MVPDAWIWVGIVASVLSLLALQPIVYQYLVAQFWPFGVKFTFHRQFAQAGEGVFLNVSIRNRTNGPAYFQIGARYESGPEAAALPFRFVHIQMYRHVPLNQPFSGHLVMAPGELDSLFIRYIPTVRGHYRFMVEITEFNTWSRLPRWVGFKRRVLRRKNPKLHLIEFKKEVEFTAATWAIAPDHLKDVIGRERTTEEIELEGEFTEQINRQAAARAPPMEAA
jgi:hypothetical protein